MPNIMHLYEGAVWLGDPTESHFSTASVPQRFTCRMKMDVKNDNYNMFDLIAYRVKFAQHPRAGATWCAVKQTRSPTAACP
jgi:glutamyl/glutaminyl-tRNA synthetase